MLPPRVLPDRAVRLHLGPAQLVGHRLLAIADHTFFGNGGIEADHDIDGDLLQNGDQEGQESNACFSSFMVPSASLEMLIHACQLS